MSKLGVAILRNYLDPKANREGQLKALGALESYLNGVAKHARIDVTATNLTVASQDVEDMLLNLVVITDDISGCFGDDVATASRLEDARGYLNLLYVKCNLSRETCLHAYQCLGSPVTDKE